MNNLSWALYLADVAGRAGSTLSVFVFLATLATMVSFILWVAANVSGDFSDNDRIGTRRLFLCVLAFCVFFSTLRVIAPSKQALHMIAASEMGEEAIQTPEFSKMRKLLNRELDKALKPEGKEL